MTSYVSISLKTWRQKQGIKQSRNRITIKNQMLYQNYSEVFLVINNYLLFMILYFVLTGILHFKCVHY